MNNLNETNLRKAITRWEDAYYSMSGTKKARTEHLEQRLRLKALIAKAYATMGKPMPLLGYKRVPPVGSGLAFNGANGNNGIITNVAYTIGG